MVYRLTSCGTSLVIWDHTVLPATRHKRTRPANPSRAGWYSIYLPRRDGRLSWVILNNACRSPHSPSEMHHAVCATVIITHRPGCRSVSLFLCMVVAKQQNRRWSRWFFTTTGCAIEQLSILYAAFGRPVRPSDRPTAYCLLIQL